VKPYKIILSGGGTGGHIYPAISIADEFVRRYPDAEVLFVGAQDRMEIQKVPAAGYDIKGLWISGFQRRISLKNLLFPVKLVKSLFDARSIIKDFEPDIAVGTGGFASGPTLRVAASASVPTVLQEQNSYAGVTNKLLAGRADRICVAYEGMDKFFPKEKIRLTGNPVRADIGAVNLTRSDALEGFGLNPNKTTILILGGSLGARSINDLIEKNLSTITENAQIIWQCGKLYHEQYKSRHSNVVKVHAFLEDMPMAYAAADIIISRAGAGTISELSIVGKPVIFIPSPNVAEDHQTKNAQTLAEDFAAIMIRESETGEKFMQRLKTLLADQELRDQLSQNIKTKALPSATSDIVDEIEKLLKK